MNKLFQFLLFPIRYFLRIFFKDYELKIAGQYLFSFKRDFNFISIITFISFLGITIGIAALIIILSIFNGFRDFAQEQVINFDPHIKIILKGQRQNDIDTKNSEYFQEHYSEIESFLQSKSDILSYSPVINGKVIIKINESLQVAYLNGLDTNKIKKVSGVVNRCVAGKFSLSEEKGVQNVVIGAGLADNLGIVPFDTLFLMSPDMIETSLKQMDLSNQIPAKAAGFFMSYSKEYDESTVFSSIEFAEKIFYKKDKYQRNFDIKLKDIKQIDNVINEIKAKFHNDEVLSWYDLHSDMFNIMKLERLMVFVILSLIIIIATFNLLASLTMTVVEKQRDIAILKAIGAENSSIRNIFVAEGILIGTLSVLLGTALGLIFCYGQIEFNWFSLDTTKYLIKGIPITLDFWNIVAIDTFALILSIVSTILPAKYAYKQEISDALRNN